MALREASQRLAGLKLKKSGFDIVASGFERTYRQGRRRMLELSVMHTDEASHDWRNRVQAHWRQLALFRPAWPDYFDVRIATARRLAEALGRDHDLAVLAVYAAGPARDILGNEGVRAITQMIGQKQAEIRKQTLIEGGLLFADKPRALTKQIRRYWAIASQ